MRVSRRISPPKYEIKLHLALLYTLDTTGSLVDTSLQIEKKYFKAEEFWACFLHTW